MAWHRPGNKPLSEAMMVSLLTHICVARPQLVKRLPPSCPYGQPMGCILRVLWRKMPMIYWECSVYHTYRNFGMNLLLYWSPSAPHSTSIYHRSGWWGGLAVWWPLTHGAWHFIITQTSIDRSSQGETQYEGPESICHIITQWCKILGNKNVIHVVKLCLWTRKNLWWQISRNSQRAWTILQQTLLIVKPRSNSNTSLISNGYYEYYIYYNHMIFK